MLTSTSNVPINVDYFMSIVKKSGLTHREFSESVGRTKSFVYNAKDRAYMQLPTAKLLCKIYGADLDKLIAIDEPKEATAQNADEQSINTLVKALINIDKKLDMLIRELH